MTLPPRAPLTPLIGHNAQWQALARAFAQDKIPQTLLLSGPPQIGKWTLAKRYSQLLLCAHPVTIDELPAPCGACTPCHQVNIETFPDYKVYRPLVSSEEDEKKWVIAPPMMSGSLISIAVARRFGSEAIRKPLAGPRKVMLLTQADRMVDEAQNALLKTFEEPIPGLTIFLLCDNAATLLPTIRSRCWHIPLNFVSDQKIRDWLSTKNVGSNIFTDDQIEIAIRAAAGRPGVAQRVLARFQEHAKPSSDPQLPLSRLEQIESFIARLHKSTPVGALRFTEEALALSEEWWEEEQLLSDAGPAQNEIKKGDAKIARSSLALFLDELARVYRTRWEQSLRASSGDHPRWSNGLDHILKTRHYILRNANSALALDVLFGHLIQAC